MTIRVYYCDLRKNKSQLIRSVVKWELGISARRAISLGLGNEIGNTVANDLSSDNTHLVVAWNDFTTGEISEMGGVGSLDFELKDNNVLTITYEDETTTQVMLDESSDWMLKGEM